MSEEWRVGDLILIDSLEILKVVSMDGKSCLCQDMEQQEDPCNIHRFQRKYYTNITAQQRELEGLRKKVQG